MTHTPIITLIGGSGFLGRYVARRLAKAGYRLRIICRNPDAAAHLKTAGDVGQIALVAGNIARPETLKGKLDGSFAVINLVGVLFESGKQNFTALHAKGAETLALMAREAGAERFIQISSLGVDRAADSAYARTKLLGEKAVQAAFPAATILRPSVVFGAEDNFFNQFAQMASLAPALPLIGGGKTRFQPVYVDDVAAAVEASLNDETTMGETYELGGPRVYSFREILEYILRTTDRRRYLAPLPMALASMIGAASEILPRPPLTRDQVRLLKYDNIVSPGARSFAHLGITPTAVETIVPGYLARYNRKVAA
ncbi:MAG: complex I NDUFA9 subunit family protein [Alphaproteobacteria bacterium]|nr:complex I NDUFA9 subunit family protein [Alphaproteobacteria bacterium]